MAERDLDHESKKGRQKRDRGHVKLMNADMIGMATLTRRVACGLSLEGEAEAMRKIGGSQATLVGAN